MIAEITIQQAAAWFVGSCVALTTFAVAIEKVFSPFGKWIRSWVTDPLSDQLRQHEKYVGYHLGPNGTTTPIHQRIAALEESAKRQEER